MAAKLVIMCCVVATAVAVAVPVVPVAKLTKVAYAEPEAPAHYEFQYSVHDEHSGDVKEQQESRAGDDVHGHYSLMQPDGVRRIVEYTASKEHGFNAVVHYEGHPAPAPVTKVAYAPAPLTKFAYAPAPLTKIAYAPAPVAKVAYAPAPLTKIAYAPAPVAKVAYAPAPLTKFAYAPAPLTKIAYAPVPVAKVAYAPAKVLAAPVAKVAYSAPLGHVTFSSPAISYHH